MSRLSRSQLLDPAIDERKVPDPKSVPIMPRRQRGSRRLSVVFMAGKCISMSVISRPLRPTSPDTRAGEEGELGNFRREEKLEAHAAQYQRRTMQSLTLFVESALIAQGRHA